MNDKKIYFYRDKSIESQEAKNILDEHQVKYEEIYSDSDRELPCILVSGSAVPFSGSDGVSQFVDFFADVQFS